MADEKEVKNAMNTISETLAQYLEVKDIILENEYFEVLGDSISVLKLLKNANSLIAKKRLQHFLRGFDQIGEPSNDMINRLLSYIDNESKAEFIADMFSKVLLSNSKLSCAIMGSIVYRITEDNQDISHGDLVCIDALTKFFDYDIKNFRLLCDFMNECAKEGNKNASKGFNYNYKPIKYCVDKGSTNVSSVNLTIEKAVSCQLFVKEAQVDLDIDEEDVGLSSVDTYEYCSITKPGEQLYNYIINLKLE